MAKKSKRAMTNTSWVVAVVLAASLGACRGPQMATALEVIEMKDGGAADTTVLEWVNDPSRTFDLTDNALSELVGAGISEEIINAMLAKSQEHHEKESHADEHAHEH